MKIKKRSYTDVKREKTSSSSMNFLLNAISIDTFNGIKTFLEYSKKNWRLGWMDKTRMTELFKNVNVYVLTLRVEYFMASYFIAK